MRAEYYTVHIPQLVLDQIQYLNYQFILAIFSAVFNNESSFCVAFFEDICRAFLFILCVVTVVLDRIQLTSAVSTTLRQ